MELHYPVIWFYIKLLLYTKHYFYEQEVAFIRIKIQE